MIGQTIKKHWGLSFFIVIAVIGATAAALLPPLVLGKAIDTMTKGRGIPLSMILLYFGFTAVTGLMESLREGLLTLFGQKITHALRSGMMRKYTRLTANSLTAMEPGAVVSRFVGDVDTVENLFTSGMISMFADACKIVSIFAVIWFQNPGLAVVLLFLLPVLFWFTRMVQKNMLTAQLKNRIAVSRASGHVPETLKNIRTIHCLSKEAYMEKRYDEYIGEGYQAMERTNFYDAVYSPVIILLNAIVVAVMNYISQIFSPVESLGMEIQTIQSAIAGVKRMNEFLAEEELPENSMAEEEIPEQEKKGCLVEFQDVTFAYEEQEVLKHLSFQVKEKEQVTLLGRTGAGKSTILKLLLGLYEPAGGRVTIEGVPAGRIPASKKRKLFGYVEQSFYMVPGTVREQITLYDRRISEKEVENAARLVGLDTVIESFEQGYETICTRELFSEGQWQLLSIARAAVADPRLLLLDEITANLDAQTEKMVLDALQRVAGGRTVISISHRINAKTGRVINLPSGS